MKALYKKELNFYLNNPIGYIVIILFALFANFLFVKDIFVTGSASMKPFFSTVPWLFLIFIPAIAMRSFAEERRAGTLELLLTLPLSESQVVIAKWAALKTLVVVSLLLTAGLPLTLGLLTKVPYLEILVGYIGLLFLADFLIALCMFFSSITKNQIIAFLSGVIAVFLLYSVSTDFAGTILPRFVVDAIVSFSPVYQLQSFIKGIIDIRSVVYFLSITGLFLFFTISDLERRS